MHLRAPVSRRDRYWFRKRNLTATLFSPHGEHNDSCRSKNATFIAASGCLPFGNLSSDHLCKHLARIMRSLGNVLEISYIRAHRVTRSFHNRPRYCWNAFPISFFTPLHSDISRGKAPQHKQQSYTVTNLSEISTKKLSHTITILWITAVQARVNCAAQIRCKDD